jgi:hypothetical protein
MNKEEKVNLLSLKTLTMFLDSESLEDACIQLVYLQNAHFESVDVPQYFNYMVRTCGLTAESIKLHLVGTPFIRRILISVDAQCIDDNLQTPMGVIRDRAAKVAQHLMRTMGLSMAASYKGAVILGAVIVWLLA